MRRISESGRWLLAAAAVAMLAGDAGAGGKIGPWPGASSLENASANIVMLREDGSLTAIPAGSHPAVVPATNDVFCSIGALGRWGVGLKWDGSLAIWEDNAWPPAPQLPATNSDFVAVSAGTGHFAALKEDGTIVVCGTNNYGQLDLPPGYDDFVAVSCGGMHTLALRSNGVVVAWGWNNYGQTDVPEPNTNFTAIAAGGHHSVALRLDGSVVVWGRTNYGITVPPEPNTGFVGINAGLYNSFARKADGSVAFWGSMIGISNVPPPNLDFVANDSFGYYASGVKADGTYVLWGDTNGSGRVAHGGVLPPNGLASGGDVITIIGTGLGNGTDITNVTLCGVQVAEILGQTRRAVRVRAGVSPVATNGDVVVHSTSQGMTVASNAFTYQGPPVVETMPIEYVWPVHVIVNGRVLDDGGMPVQSSWFVVGRGTEPGTNDIVVPGAMLGNAFTGAASNLWPGTAHHVTAYASNAAGVGAGQKLIFTNLCCVYTTIWPHGDASPQLSFVPPGSNVTFSFWAEDGYLISKILVDSVSIGSPGTFELTNITTNVHVEVVVQAANMRIGPYRYAGVGGLGTDFSVLLRSFGYLALDGDGLRDAYDFFQTWPFVSLDAESQYLIGLTSSGTVCCAPLYERDWYGNIVSTNMPSVNAGFVAAAVGEGTFFGVRRNGRVEVWGPGAGDFERVTGFGRVVDVAAGEGLALFLHEDGTIDPWGPNATWPPEPWDSFTKISCGKRHMLGLERGGRIVAWGDNSSGQCDVPEPNTNFVEIAGGGDFSLGLKSDGRIIAWGSNYGGQCNVPEPNTNFVKIACGTAHALGIRADSSAILWGMNNRRQCPVLVNRYDYGLGKGVIPVRNATGTATPVEIIGEGFDAVTNVTLCGIPVSSIVTQTEYLIDVVPGVSLTPTNGDVVVYSATKGTAIATNAFYYGAVPTVTVVASGLGTNYPDGTLVPSTSWFVFGDAVQIWGKPDKYYHANPILINGADWFCETDGEYTWCLYPFWAGSVTATVTFVENLATNATPEWWLAQYGWTNSFDAAAVADSDGDGAQAWAEYFAGTDPTNRGSVFELTATSNAPDGFVVAWNSASNKTYDLLRGTNLLTGFGQTNAGILATPPMNVYTDMFGSGSAYYRIRVR